MVKELEVLAVIPARGGSKGIPRKNIRDFAGHPLIAYSVAAGLQSKLVTRTIVSTDDQEIAEVARRYGAEIPFIRPPELAEDQTLDLPVFQHALQWLAEEENYHPDVVVQLRPTSPIRPLNCVDEAIRLLVSHPEADSVRGVVPAGQNPFKMWRIDESSSVMTPLLEVEGVPEPYNAPRQMLPSAYWQTGHIDAIRPKVILQCSSMSGRMVLALMIDPVYTVDIDNLRDWAHYEWVVDTGKIEMVTPGPIKRRLPSPVDLVVFDFDGVMTDNRVWVDQNGLELVAAHRGDGLGLARLRRAGIAMMVISTETNPVVEARCTKLNIPVIQGVEEKAVVLRKYLKDQNIQPTQVVYLGNDVNDLPCFTEVGCAVAVADSHPDVLKHADIVLQQRGGYGAVRELCDRVLDVCTQKTLDRI
jgi:YrbI family 3-deoxy-D-manno-octulosonate 8-phosphate phosphatase